MSAMVGIEGIEPDFPMLGRFGNEPGLAAGVAVDVAAKLRRRLPDAISQSTTSGCPPRLTPSPPMVIRARESEVKPTSFGADASVIVCTSRPEVTSQILTWLEGRPPIVLGPCVVWSSMY